LVSLPFSNTSIVNFELKLEQVWGGENLYLVQSWPSQDEIVRRGDVDYQDLYLQVPGFDLVPKAEDKLDNSRGINFLSSKTQDGMD